MKIEYVKHLDAERLRDMRIVSIDTETTGLHWYRDHVFGIAVAGYDGERIVASYTDIREHPRYLEHLARVVPSVQLFVNHNIKYDTHFLRKAKVPLPLDRLDCTQVRAALINEHDDLDLDSLGKKYLGEGKPTGIYEELAKLFGGEPTRKAQMKNLHRAPERLAARYAAPDPVLALRLWLWQEQEIAKQDDFDKSFDPNGRGLRSIVDLERRLLPVLIKLESRGVRVDEQLAAQSIYKVDKAVMEAQDALNQIAGKSVNANSPVQMRELFKIACEDVGDGKKIWRTDSGFQVEQTDGGNPSLAKKSLKIMEGLGDARAKHVLTIRRMVKCKSFLKDHILGHAFGGRVYPNYNQTRGENELGTGTGRFSVDDPALQQIPMHDTDVAKIVRPCFLPEPGHLWGCADWKQFEFRWFAHYVKDANILERYNRDPNTDYHQVTADITGITRDRKFAGDTANAKQINLGLVFGMGEGEMAYNMGMEYSIRRDRNGREWKVAGEKAKEVFNKYHAAIPGVRKLLDQAASIARARGYIKTMMGRHIRFPNGSHYKAGGLTFQGTSADCIKYKMIEMDPVCEREGFNMNLSVHDELDFSTPEKEAKRHAELARNVLQTFDGERCPIKCRVPILSSVSLGINWWEACKE